MTTVSNTAMTISGAGNAPKSKGGATLAVGTTSA